MIFGPVDVDNAAGAILAHSLVANGLRIKKGNRLTNAHISALKEAGIRTVTVARLEDGDVSEDDAAQRLADCLHGTVISVTAPFTGRANLYADAAGILAVNESAVRSMNAVDEALTLATLPNMARVAPRQMIATVKVIPYAVAETAVTAAIGQLSEPVLQLHPFEVKSADLILTRTDGFKESLLSKARQAVNDRLNALGVTLQNTQIVAHDTSSVAAAMKRAESELVLVFGASATSDRKDVCPAALVTAGGTLTRFGMPVDPGNLLFLGELNKRPVIGLPGCARSPALNGADWVLERIVAGLDVSDADIGAMGVGGLLKEIPSRPRPREGRNASGGKPRVDVMILAAGASKRMDGRDKLLELVDGVPLLHRSSKTALHSQADGVRVVLPPDRPGRVDALEGLAVTRITAQNAADGMATSLAAGLGEIDENIDAVIVALADMPDITADHINRLIAAFDPDEGREIVRALDENGQPGHPVLFARRFFDSLRELKGDDGAKTIISQFSEFVVEVPTKGLGATTDLDTPADWARWLATRKSVA